MPNAIYVGGSGQHAALATARLMLLRALPDTIQCQVLDADDGDNGIAGPLRSLDGYVTPRHAHPFGTAIKAYLKPFDPEALAGGEAETTFRSLFGLNPDAVLDREVFDALYTAEAADTDILRGFYAKPSLGASAFLAHGQAGLGNLRAWVGHADKVFVIGSFLGGTGAGVIPALVRQLAQGNNWYGVFLLNWLAPPHNASVTLAEMRANQQHGLEYFYKDVRPRLAASVLLGAPPANSALTSPKVPADKGETRSFYPLVAARAMFDLMSDAYANNTGQVRVWSHDDAAPGHLLDEAWHGRKTLKQRIHDAERASHWLGYYRDNDAVERLKAAFRLMGTRAAVPNGLHDLKKWAKAADVSTPDFIVALVADLKHRCDGLDNACKALRDLFGDRDVGRDTALAQVPDRLDALKRALPRAILPEIERMPIEQAVTKLAQQLVDAVRDYTH